MFGALSCYCLLLVARFHCRSLHAADVILALGMRSSLKFNETKTGDGVRRSETAHTNLLNRWTHKHLITRWLSCNFFFFYTSVQFSSLAMPKDWNFSLQSALTSIGRWMFLISNKLGSCALCARLLLFIVRLLQPRISFCTYAFILISRTPHGAAKRFCAWWHRE